MGTIWDLGTVWNDWTCSRETEFLCSRKICPTKSNGENNTLLIGSLSLSGVLLLLLIIQTTGVICCVCKTKSQKIVAKEDENPMYGVDYEADADVIDKSHKTASNTENSYYYES